MFPGTFPVDVFPKALVASLIVLGCANYFIIGPKIAERVVSADYLPACEANFRETVVKAGENRERSLELPSIDPMQDFAASQAQRLLQSPLMRYLRGASRGMGESIGFDIEGAADAALRQIEAQKRAAKQAYDTSRAAIEEQTKTHLAASGDICGCIADAAIAETRKEWAIFTGTLTLIAPAPISTFDQKMAAVQRAGTCQIAKADQ